MEKIRNMICAVVLTMPCLCAAQIDYDRIILPDGVYSEVYEEKLVRLAWKNNPASQMAADEISIANYDFMAAKARWTSIFFAQGNLNEFTIKNLGQSATDGTTTNTNQFYPRYNFSVNVPMSTIFELPRIRKSARAKVELSKDKMNQLKLEIRNTVFKLYSDFKKYEQIRNLRKEALEVEDLNLGHVQDRFKKGDASYEEYVQAQRARNQFRIELVTAESDYAKSKFDIEAIIGIRLEDVR
jgi:outer membrane protein TolC